jgi:hypothetical protein
MRLANYFITRLGPLGNDSNPKNATVVHPFDIINTCVTAALRWSFGFKMMAKLHRNLGILVHSVMTVWRLEVSPDDKSTCNKIYHM